MVSIFTGSSALQDSQKHLSLSTDQHVCRMLFCRMILAVPQQVRGAGVFVSTCCRIMQCRSASLPCNERPASVCVVRFGGDQPVYINIIRDPVSRFLSNYFFRRFGDWRGEQNHMIRTPSMRQEERYLVSCEAVQPWISAFSHGLFIFHATVL